MKEKEALASIICLQTLNGHEDDRVPSFPRTSRASQGTLRLTRHQSNSQTFICFFLSLAAFFFFFFFCNSSLFSLRPPHLIHNMYDREGPEAAAGTIVFNLIHNCMPNGQGSFPRGSAAADRRKEKKRRQNAKGSLSTLHQCG